MIGDGEANEGTVWEAVQVADSLGLENLTIIYDNNLSHSRGLQVRYPKKNWKLSDVMSSWSTVTMSMS